MRIGVDYRPCTAAPHTGIARQAFAIVESLNQIAGVTAVPFTVAPPEHPHRQFAICPAWSSAALHRPEQRLRFEQGFLPGAIKAQGLDAYIATANSGLPWWQSGQGIPSVVLLHDIFQLTMPNYGGLRAGMYRLFDRVNIGRSLQVARRVWTPSQFSAEEAGREFATTASKLRVLHNRVDFGTVPDMQAPAGLPERYWLAVGLRERRKNIAILLEAWQAARHSSRGVPALVLVGQRDEVPPAYRDQPGIQFLSGLSDGALAAVYAGAELLWHPSYAEGFGLPPLEALARGAPVAVARGSSLDEVVPLDSPRFDPHNGGALVQLMFRLADTPLPRDQDSYRAWVSRFDGEAHRQRLAELLEDLLGRTL